MTYSIVARDNQTGEVGVATQSQAFAVGNSVPFALPGFGVIATQSMAEPMYGSVGLDLLQGGFTAQEVLTALSSVDPHPGRRQVAVLGVNGDLAAYTGEQCVDEAGHLQGDTCVALANMATSPAVWTSMVESFEGSAGPIAQPLSYLYRSANNLMLDRYRSYQQAVKRDQDWSDAASTSSPSVAANGSTFSATRRQRETCSAS